MNAVTIHDSEACQLADLLALAGADALAAWWVGERVDCLGPGAEALVQEAEAGPISGVRLTDLAAGVTQMLCGDFEATLAGEAQPWLVVKCIRGMYFVVVTRSEALLAEIGRRFQDVRPSPLDTEWYNDPDNTPEPDRRC